MRSQEDWAYMAVQYCQNGQYNLGQRLQSWKTLKKKGVILVIDLKLMIIKIGIHIKL